MLALLIEEVQIRTLHWFCFVILRISQFKVQKSLYPLRITVWWCICVISVLVFLHLPHLLQIFAVKNLHQIHKIRFAVLDKSQKLFLNLQFRMVFQGSYKQCEVINFVKENYLAQCILVKVLTKFHVVIVASELKINSWQSYQIFWYLLKYQSQLKYQDIAKSTRWLKSQHPNL